MIDHITVRVIPTVTRRPTLGILAALMGRAVVITTAPDCRGPLGLRHTLDKRTANVPRRTAADRTVIADLTARVRGARAEDVAGTLAAGVDARLIEAALAVGDAARPDDGGFWCWWL